MATPPLLRWGLTFSFAFALIALALAFRLQQTQQPLIDLSPPSSSPVTHCYRRVRTQDEDQPTAECFSVVDGNFDRVWTGSEVAAADSSEHGDDDAVQRSDGYVVPGLWDGHGHLLAYGEFLHSVDLFGSESLDEVRSRVKEYLAANPGAGTKDQWLRGVGWDQTAFGRMPTAVRIAVPQNQ
jgi:predicted amidohydrolase YtcJ